MQTNKIMFKLLLYVLVFTIMVFIIGNIMNTYYKNVKALNNEAKVASEVSKFDLYMLKNIKAQNTKIRKVGIVDEDENSYYITFQKDDGSTNSFIKKGNIIYYNQIKLCENVDFFRVVVDRSEKESITVDLTINGKEHNLQYVIS